MRIASAMRYRKRWARMARHEENGRSWRAAIAHGIIAVFMINMYKCGATCTRVVGSPLRSGRAQSRKITRRDRLCAQQRRRTSTSAGIGRVVDLARAVLAAQDGAIWFYQHYLRRQPSLNVVALGMKIT